MKKGSISALGQPDLYARLRKQHRLLDAGASRIATREYTAPSTRHMECGNQLVAYPCDREGESVRSRARSDIRQEGRVPCAYDAPSGWCIPFIGQAGCQTLGMQSLHADLERP